MSVDNKGAITLRREASEFKQQKIYRMQMSAFIVGKAPYTLLMLITVICIFIMPQLVQAYQLFNDNRMIQPLQQSVLVPYKQAATKHQSFNAQCSL